MFATTFFVVMANPSIQGTPEKLRFSVPSLRSVAPDLERWAANMLARISLVVLAVLASSAQAQSVSPITKDVTALSATSAGLKSEVVIASVEVNSTDVIPGAAAGQFPERFRVVRSLTIKLNGRELFVPRSAYADLVWVAHAELNTAKPMSLLVISGGDASESYSAKIEFDQAAVRSRKLYANENPGGPTEQTRYFSRVLN